MSDENVDVAVIPTEELSAAQRSAVIDVCVAADDNEDFRNLFKVYIRSGGRHFLAYRGSRVVSHAVVTPRWVQPQGQRVLRTAYVDAVATDPDVQHRGYASATMQRLATAIDDFEISCLQTDRESFYEQFGWEVWRGPLAGRSDDELIPTPEQRGVMVLRLPSTPPLDLETRLSIERQPHRIWE